MAQEPVDNLTRILKRAQDRRALWEPLWQECARFGQPSRNFSFGAKPSPGRQLADLFDGTAADGIEQLAASLMAELAPPWSNWFSIVPGHDINEDMIDEVGLEFQQSAARIHSHFDRSNFYVEMHQCLLDLVTFGTATLLFEESKAGRISPFHFTAVPLSEMYFSGNANGQIQTQIRKTSQGLAEIIRRFPKACDWNSLCLDIDDVSQCQVDLIENVAEKDGGYEYIAYTLINSKPPILLSEGVFDTSPFITFRWLKGTGELYGRSPLMTALPDIKTANKVVELILKNASIAVTGIWQAEDDGVINPANINLVPGSIIPKAAGSSGLTPLQSPGRLDVSQIVLNDLRARIRQTMMTDRLGPARGSVMTATEVVERSSETSRLLGAVFGRLQTEFLTPLIGRALRIGARRGDIAVDKADGTIAEIEYLSPLARMQSRDEVRNVMLWLDAIAKLGSLPNDAVDHEATVRWLANSLGVPNELVVRSNEDALAELELQDIQL